MTFMTTSALRLIKEGYFLQGLGVGFAIGGAVGTVLTHLQFWLRSRR
jgi:hypothetical protein